MASPNCEDCKGTGEIEVETIRLSRPYFHKELKKIVHDYIGGSDWHKTQCYCVGDEEYYA